MATILVLLLDGVTTQAIQTEGLSTAVLVCHGMNIIHNRLYI